MFNPNNQCENRGFYAKNVVTCRDTSLGSQRNYCILSHFPCRSVIQRATFWQLLPILQLFIVFFPQSSSRVSILLHSSFESTISFFVLATGPPLIGPFWVADANLSALGSSTWLTSLELLTQQNKHELSKVKVSASSIHSTDI